MSGRMMTAPPAGTWQAPSWIIGPAPMIMPGAMIHPPCRGISVVVQIRRRPSALVALADPGLIDEVKLLVHEGQDGASPGRELEQRDQHQPLRLQAFRIASENGDRVVEIVERFVEDDGVEGLAGDLFLGVGGEETSPLIFESRQCGDRRRGHVEPEVTRITVGSEPTEEHTVAAADVEDRSPRLEMGQVAPTRMM